MSSSGRAPKNPSSVSSGADGSSVSVAIAVTREPLAVGLMIVTSSGVPEALAEGLAEPLPVGLGEAVRATAVAVVVVLAVVVAVTLGEGLALAVAVGVGVPVGVAADVAVAV